MFRLSRACTNAARRNLVRRCTSVASPVAPVVVDPSSEIFSKIDTAGSGVINADQFRSAMQRVEDAHLQDLRDALVSEKAAKSSFVNRSLNTAEVCVSKIFPAGFCWQASSIVAGNMGLASNSVGFALCTGLGDAMGVGFGHTLYFLVKKYTFDSSIDMNSTAQTSLLLGSASFCAGSAWQPIVNACQALGFGFDPSVASTGLVCGSMFFLGLRVGRNIYPNLGLTEIAPPTYSNLKADAGLSAAVGGAAACFVGTDVSYGDGNWLRGIVGIEETTADLVGCATAGSSTALGFAAIQTAENATQGKGKCWTD